MQEKNRKKEIRKLNLEIQGLLKTLQEKESALLENKDNKFSKFGVGEILDLDLYIKKWEAIHEKSHLLKNSKDLLALIDLNNFILPCLIKKSEKAKIISKYLDIIETNFKNYINLKNNNLFLIKERLYNFLYIKYLYEKILPNSLHKCYESILQSYQKRCKETLVYQKEPAFFVMDLEKSLGDLISMAGMGKVFGLDAQLFMRLESFAYPLELSENLKEKLKARKIEISLGKSALFPLSENAYQKAIEQLYQICFFNMFVLEGQELQTSFSDAIKSVEVLHKNSKDNRNLCILISIRIWQASSSFVERDFETSLKQYKIAKEECRKAQSKEDVLLRQDLCCFLSFIQMNIDSCHFRLGLKKEAVKKKSKTEKEIADEWTKGVEIPKNKTEPEKKSKKKQRVPVKLDPILNNIFLMDSSNTAQELLPEDTSKTNKITKRKKKKNKTPKSLNRQPPAQNNNLSNNKKTVSFVKSPEPQTSRDNRRHTQRSTGQYPREFWVTGSGRGAQIPRSNSVNKTTFPPKNANKNGVNQHVNPPSVWNQRGNFFWTPTQQNSRSVLANSNSREEAKNKDQTSLALSDEPTGSSIAVSETSLGSMTTSELQSSLLTSHPASDGNITGDMSSSSSETKYKTSEDSEKYYEGEEENDEYESGSDEYPQVNECSNEMDSCYEARYPNSGAERLMPQPGSSPEFMIIPLPVYVYNVPGGRGTLFYHPNANVNEQDSCNNNSQVNFSY